jgi:hypothetical protein
MSNKTRKQNTERTVSVHQRRGEDVDNSRARTVLMPSVQSAITVQAYYKSRFPYITLDALIKALSEEAEAANKGDFTRPEAMLSTQAHTLDTLFNDLAQRASSAEYLNQFETYLKLALKVQSQCRSTLEALAEIKNPASVSFVKQDNIAHGHQQVNNGRTTTSEPSRAGGKEENAERTKQVTYDEQPTLDPGAPGAASRTDPAMATVGALHGTEDDQR